MIYIKDDKDVLEKYDVIFDQTRLEELKSRVIKNCSEIRRVKTECKLCYVPHNDIHEFDEDRKATLYHYEDVKYKKSGNTATEWDHYDEYEVDLYDCEYTQFKCQHLVDFISDIIIGKEKSITILFNRDLKSIDRFPTVKKQIALLRKKLSKKSSDHKLMEAKINELNTKYSEFSKKTTNISESYKELESLISSYTEEISKLENKDNERVKQIRNELNYLLSIEELNQNQQPIDAYFNELVSLVDFRLVDTIGKNEINRINEFFDEEIIPFEMKKVKSLTRKK